MIDEGASREAAEQAAVGHFELGAKRMQSGELLPSWTAQLWSTLFLATLFPTIVLMITSGMAMSAKAGKEARNGYTTLRWLRLNSTEIRDSRGRAMLPGDSRLTASAKYMHAFIVIGSACALLSPLLGILRLLLT